MNFELKTYQDQAVSRLRDVAKELLPIAVREDSNKTIVFRAPTGSGKTIMMAEFLARLVAEHSWRERLAFIWTAPRDLHSQSMQKLRDFYGHGGRLVCREFDDLTDREIGANEILFLNWESINRKDKNLAIRENESGRYLGKVIENTRAAGRLIVLIIDESHHSAKTKTAVNLIRDLHPRLTVEASATPKALSEPNEVVTVHRYSVIDAGMIKKGLLLNGGFQNALKGSRVESELAKGTNAMVLKTALDKRTEIAAALRAEFESVNPLLLIQLPDAVSGEEQIKREVEKLLKDEHGISVANGKLAIYLSEDKENLANITRLDSKVEVMLFKQAIALGWDCPRAHILVLFRELHSIEFSVQTVGRILRMPNPAVGHYDDELLNIAYAYTNLGDMKIAQDLADDYLRINSSRLIDAYEPIKLPSTYRKRHRELTRLGRKFREMFLLRTDREKNYGGKTLAKAVDLKARTVNREIIVDTKIMDVDAPLTPKEWQRTGIDTHTKDELQGFFDRFVGQHISPLYPDLESVAGVRKAIYEFFDKHYQMSFKSQFTEIVQIVLDAKNSKHFGAAIQNTVPAYLEEVRKQDDELLTDEKWQVPSGMNLDDSYKKIDAPKSVMQPFFRREKWKTEKAFIQFLETCAQVQWWFKNGDQGGNNFAVPYTEHNEEKLFFVDFIVQFQDGRIGLFDTKKGFTAALSGARSDGLRAYITEQNAKRKAEKLPQLLGGIIAPVGESKKPVWKIYQGKGADLTSDTSDAGWEPVDLGG